MKVAEITVKGHSYPCRVLLGGYLRFRNLTGKEATSLNPQSLSELATLLYCFVSASCNADGKPLNLSLMDFCDNVEMHDLENFLALYNAEAESSSGTDSDAAKKKAAP